MAGAGLAGGGQAPLGMATRPCRGWGRGHVGHRPIVRRVLQLVEDEGSWDISSAFSLRNRKINKIFSAVSLA